MAMVIMFLYIYDQFDIPRSIEDVIVEVVKCLYYSGGGDGPLYGPSYGPYSGGPGCFSAGTPIEMADGSKVPIEAVRIGDWVTTMDGFPTQVSRTYVRSSEHPIELRYSLGKDLRRLETTGEHRFRVRRERGPEQWLSAQNLRVGDRLILAGHQEGILTDLTNSHTPTTVYNFDVAEGASYFANGAWVHQSCDAEEPPAWTLPSRRQFQTGQRLQSALIHQRHTMMAP